MIRRQINRAPLALAALLLLVFTGCASPNGDQRMSRDTGSTPVRLASGTVLRVPLSGPLADERATALAKELVDFDEKLKRGLLTEGIADPSVREAVFEILVESRNVAADKIDLAHRLATSTSSGTLDREVLGQGADSIRRATELLSRPPTRVYVDTRISVRGEEYALEYTGAAEYRRKEDKWINYTTGQAMKIGDYFFRLLRRDGRNEQPIHKRLEIRAQPTVQLIEPSRVGSM